MNVDPSLYEKWIGLIPVEYVYRHGIPSISLANLTSELNLAFF